MKNAIESGGIRKRQSRKWKRAKQKERQYETFEILRRVKFRKKGRSVTKIKNQLRSFFNIAHGYRLRPK